MTPMSGTELAALLVRHGWMLLRVNGSHHIYGKAGSSVRISLPIHGSTTLKVGLLKHLLKQAGLSQE